MKNSRFTAVLAATVFAIAASIFPLLISPKKVNALNSISVDFNFAGQDKSAFVFVDVGEFNSVNAAGPIMFLQYRDANGFKRYLRFYYSNPNIQGGDVSVDIQWQTNEPFLSDSDISIAEWHSARGGRVPFNSVFYFSVLNGSGDVYGYKSTAIDFGYFTDDVSNNVWSYKLVQLSDLDYGFKSGPSTWEGVTTLTYSTTRQFDFISYHRDSPEVFGDAYYTNLIFSGSSYYKNLVHSGQRNYYVGYNDGYDAGVYYNADTTTWFSSLLSGFASIFSIEIFPNVTLGVLVGIPLLLGFVYLFISFKNGR